MASQKTNESPIVSSIKNGAESLKMNPLADDQDFGRRGIELLRRIPASGIIMAGFSGVCFAVASFIVKKIPNVNSVQILVSRSIIQMAFYLPIMLINKMPLFGVPNERLPLFGRGFIGFFDVAFTYTSYRLLPLADASTIVFSAPVYTSFFAWIILKETCAFIHIINIVITIIGVLLVSKPSFLFPTPVGVYANETLTFNSNQTLIEEPDNHARVTGSLIALSAAICASLVFINIRKMPKTSAPVVINAFSVIAIICGAIYELIMSNFFPNSMFASGIGLPETPSEYFWLLGNGVCGILGQLTLTVSLKLEEAGLVSLARTIEIVCAFIFQSVFLRDEKIDWTSYLGAVLVIIAVCISAINKLLEAKPELRKRLNPCS